MRVYMAASRTETSGTSSASKILPIIKFLSYSTKKFWLAKEIACYKAFVAIFVALKSFPSSLLIVFVKATMTEFFV